MTTSTETKRRPKLAFLWPWGLIGLLFAGAASNIVMVIIAVTDPSFAVEHNYYQKALDWDKTMAQRKQNDDLGWKVKVAMKKDAKADAPRPTLQLVDQKGKVLQGAVVLVTMFHSARASKRFKQALQLAPNKREYLGRPMPMKQGLWVFEVRVVKDGKRFTAKHSLWVG